MTADSNLRMAANHLSGTTTFEGNVSEEQRDAIIAYLEKGRPPFAFDFEGPSAIGRSLRATEDEAIKEGPKSGLKITTVGGNTIFFPGSTAFEFIFSFQK